MYVRHSSIQFRVIICCWRTLIFLSWEKSLAVDKITIKRSLKLEKKKKMDGTKSRWEYIRYFLNNKLPSFPVSLIFQLSTFPRTQKWAENLHSYGRSLLDTLREKTLFTPVLSNPLFFYPTSPLSLVPFPYVFFPTVPFKYPLLFLFRFPLSSTAGWFSTLLLP